jgi:glyceraldehyde 3-phosphate dehydrogenase
VLVRRRIQTPSDAMVQSVVQPEGEVVLGASPPPRRAPGGRGGPEGLNGRRAKPVGLSLSAAQSAASAARMNGSGIDGSGIGSDATGLVRLGRMAKTRVGINGFGRIGRNFFRAHLERGGDFDVVAINDLGDAKTMGHLLKYDSVLGPLHEDVEISNGVIKAGKTELKVLSERDPANLAWRDLDVELVIESTGFFTDREGAQKHIDAGAKKVVISAPATDPDLTVVLGVNDELYDPEQHHIISNASCTTNCVAPLAKVLHDEFTIEQGFMTTIHAYTNDQQILDLPHKDLRRARAAAINLIPTSTGAARAIGLVMPDLKGKVDGISVRAPVPTGSITDLVVRLGREVTVEQVNEAYRAAAGNGPLEGIMRYADDPLVSTDIIHSQYSCIIDSLLTMANGNLAKVFGWYDNEWGYSCRLVDVVAKVAADIPAAVSA